MSAHESASRPAPPQRLRRVLTWAAIAGLTLSASAQPTATAADPTESPGVPEVVPLSGVLRVTPIEPKPQRDGDRHAAMPSGHTVTLFTEEGTAVELTGAAVADARSGDRFEGTAAIDRGVAKVLEKTTAGRILPRSAADLGELVADASAALDKPLRIVEGQTSTVVKPAAAAKAHIVDVLYARPAGYPAPSEADVDAVIARLSEFWKSQSNGQITSFTRLEYKTATPKVDICNQYAIWDYAAGPSGFKRSPNGGAGSPDSYYWNGTKSAHLLVLVPADACDAVGLGTMGTIHAGGTVWAAVDDDPLDWDGTVFHEIGHNLGLDHSNATECDPPAVDGPNCTIWEYDDYYDVMGGGFTYDVYDDGQITSYTNKRHIAALNVTHKVLLDALPRGSALRTAIAADGSEQQYTLAPAGADTGLRGLEIVDPLNKDKLYLEYRSGTGRDALSFYSQYSAANPDMITWAPGVRVLKITDTGESTVLQRWDGTVLSLSYAPGTVFTSRSRKDGVPGVQISVVSTDASGARVDIAFAPVPDNPPVSALRSATPTISGTPRIGVKLTAKPGKWTTGTKFTYQWLVNGKTVKGATKSTFTPRKSDKGKQVTVKVTGTKPGYTTATKTSKKSPKVQPLLSLKTATPTISGKPKIGTKLTAKPGKWTTGTKFTYQWLVNGKTIKSATKSTFTPRKTDKGKKITVKVTGTKAGHKTTSKTSKATTKVAN